MNAKHSALGKVAVLVIVLFVLVMTLSEVQEMRDRRELAAADEPAAVAVPGYKLPEPLASPVVLYVGSGVLFFIGGVLVFVYPFLRTRPRRPGEGGG